MPAFQFFHAMHAGRTQPNETQSRSVCARVTRRKTFDNNCRVMRRLMMMMMMMILTLVTMGVQMKALSQQTVDLCHNIHTSDLEIPSGLSSSTQCLEVKRTRIPVIRGSAFTGLHNLRRVHIVDNDVLKTVADFAFSRLPQLANIFISQNAVLESIGAFAFSDLPELIELTIAKSKHLTSIHPDAFKDLVKLRRLIISNTGILTLPDFSKMHSAADYFVLDLHDNSRIQKVPANAFNGACTQAIRDIRLTRNGIKTVARDAFNGTKMHRLSLKGNRQLSYIHPNAFASSSELVLIDISQTALSSLPDAILGNLHSLIAESAVRLKKFPPPQAFAKLHEARVTYPSHCCIFLPMQRNSSKHPLCSLREARENAAFFWDHCLGNFNVTCSPAPDAFNPCEDIMTSASLRGLIWVVSVLALLGNVLVLLVLLGSASKLTVPRFLMCHLAFADLCMGVYLLVIAATDTLTRGHYHNHAIDWQTGLGCEAAGFFTVFASELSVFTLTAITLERWHTITHALRLDRKFRLRHACAVMTAGWIFSCLAATMPTLGVSSYSKVSICLPMDVESSWSQVYVVSLLLLNMAAFACVCACYLSIYLAVRHPSGATARADARVAQRMAVLVFTDFLCMAPISFFAVSAALKRPLITVSDAKLLLVLFYPINSCANPFLYAFFTRAFRRDFVLLVARFGLCKARAHGYRADSSSCQLKSGPVNMCLTSAGRPGVDR
ncbi:LOW QUALITY PROTEIN: follicle-stimulating hormone receptor [Hippocampus zosterae]|uniref:LOW QUALITY PROTEIN: follicle-stimulating hormone receptor n=1 Tax=Hippocampus zosterae TaxID=109293 RepID=UPI00223D1131|nr:LOW QUALITY PROTEIN: follicle-stimulating hormone receptor [Hippocampus zosterae]